MVVDADFGLVGASLPCARCWKDRLCEACEACECRVKTFGLARMRLGKRVREY